MNPPSIFAVGVPPPEAPGRPHPLADLGQPESERNETNIQECPPSTMTS